MYISSRMTSEGLLEVAPVTSRYSLDVFLSLSILKHRGQGCMFTFKFKALWRKVERKPNNLVSDGRLLTLP